MNIWSKIYFLGFGQVYHASVTSVIVLHGKQRNSQGFPLGFYKILSEKGILLQYSGQNLEEDLKP